MVLPFTPIGCYKPSSHVHNLVIHNLMTILSYLHLWLGANEVSVMHSQAP